MQFPKDMDKNTFHFTQLILSLSASCMVQLGKSPNPMTNKIEKNLEQAEASISLLEMLQAKTKGNLTKDEQLLIDTTITNLRLNFVDEAKKGKDVKDENANKDE